MSDHKAGLFDISRTKLRQGLVIGLLCAAITIALTLANVFETLELKSLDLRLNQLPVTSADNMPTDVVIVAIDQGSLDAILKTTDQRWPWPREFYGLIANYLSSAGAQSIVFDMWFSEPDIQRQDVDAEMSDAAFIKATRDSGNVFHGYVLKRSGQPLPPPKHAKLLEALSDYQCVLAPSLELMDHNAAVFPLADLADASRDVGFLNSAMPGDKDNVLRRFSPLAKYQETPCLSLPATVAWNNAGRPEITASDGTFSLGKMNMPIDSYGQALLWWYKTSEGNSAFKTYSAHDVLRSAILERQSLKPMIPHEAFKDKIVLVGSTAQGLFDVKATPLSPKVPGIEVQATAMANLFYHDFVSYGSRTTLLITLLGLCIAIGISARSASHVVTGSAFAVIIIAGICVAGYLALATYHTFIEIVPLLAGALLSFLATTLMNYFTEQQHAKLVRGIFEHYLDRSIVKALIRNPAQVRLGGETRTCTVIFSDVANFTNISEGLTPEKLVTFMNVYLDAMTEIIISEGGFVDKFIGDEIIAIFGAPNDLPDHATCACRAVTRMRQQAIDLQDAFADLGCTQEVFARTGISTGEMVVGNMGSEERMNYTAMGDAMNLGARIEGTNKVYGTRAMASESTVTSAKDSFVFRELDTVQVKGKVTGARISELIGRDGEVPDDKLAMIGRFTDGLAHYRDAEWNKALALFLQNDESDDRPSRVMATRCREFIENPPPEPWDGIYVMTTK